MKRLYALLGVMATFLLIGVATPGVANATPGTAGSGVSAPQWFGAQHVTVNTTTDWGGWVDGNGPDSYQAQGLCNDKSVQQGVIRWAGDRRGSFVHCSSGFNRHNFVLIPA